MMSSLINGLFATSWPPMEIEAQFMKPHKIIPQEKLTPTSRNKII
jgi:hypothetical protein